ncbi:SpoIIE family protein phosphatase, partial [Bacillus altitudinis]|uniref:SpoIIE family protein phosphatase n=1 Tax=Bacillus altitudinis TaxID=293387 RepID=UPI001F15E412
MINYPIDSLPHSRTPPTKLLKTLNPVVQQNLHPTMFITIFYPNYNKETHQFNYPSPPHHPPFFYSKKHNQFYHLHPKRLL